MKNIIFYSSIIIIFISIIFFLINENNIHNSNNINNEPLSLKIQANTSIKDSHTTSQKKVTTDYSINKEKEKTTTNQSTPSRVHSGDLSTPTVTEDDRHLFPGVDFTGITNFKVTSTFDTTNFLNDYELPLYEQQKSKLQTIKIGTADQGDIFYNAGKDYLIALLKDENTDTDLLLNKRAFPRDSITIDYVTDQSPNFVIIFIKSNDINVESFNMASNYIATCKHSNNKEIITHKNLGVLDVTQCEDGLNELNDSDYIKIDDEKLYSCLSANSYFGTTKEGYINKFDVISISCDLKYAKDLSVLAQFPNLQFLAVFNSINDPSILSKLTNLKFLSLMFINSENKTFDLKNIDTLSNLESFSVRNINLINTNALTNLTKLKSLTINSATFDSVAFTSFLTNIIYFDITNNNLDTFPDIGFGHKIETIKASKNNIRHIDGFENFPYLEELNLRDNLIYSLANLDLENTRYKKVDVFSNPVNCDQSKMKKYSFLKVKCN